jgi:pantoate--beta-alanine ligase
MAEDLCMPVTISSAPIYREPDGLAMSSRNSFITVKERPKVTVLKESLEWIASQISSGDLDFPKLEAEAIKKIDKAGFRTDYVTISNSKTLEPAAIDDSQITILGAMFTQSARLIDNVSIELMD